MIAKDATVTSKGQVTIPKEIREKLELESGTEVEFVLEDTGAVTVRPKESTVEALRSLKKRIDADDVDLDEMREESKRAWSDHLDGAD